MRRQRFGKDHRPLAATGLGGTTMCNLYNVTTNQEAIRQLTRAMIDSIGNLEPELDLYPDQMGPIVRNAPAGREMVKVRWGLPSPQNVLFDAATKRADKLRAKGKQVNFDELLRMEPDGGVTNVRNIDSKHWKRWFGVENRCVVPFTLLPSQIPQVRSREEERRMPGSRAARMSR